MLVFLIEKLFILVRVNKLYMTNMRSSTVVVVVLTHTHIYIPMISQIKTEPKNIVCFQPCATSCNIKSSGSESEPANKSGLFPTSH